MMYSETNIEEVFNMKHTSIRRIALALALAFAMAAGVMAAGVMAEEAAPAAQPVAAATVTDTNPAIYVTQKTANSVVGVITNDKSWNRTTRETSETMISQGSGVVIAEGGYVLTNAHVVESGSSYQVLLPSGESTNAALIGTDVSTDLAVLKVDDVDGLVPIDIGSSGELIVGQTAIAIGNPGGEVLANTVTSGIISALERDVEGSNTTRSIKYIQHDAPINNGNSGGGLFDVSGRLIGINTLKYAGSTFSSVSFEGLGFAIPIDTAYPIAMALIKDGRVIRPQMGVTVTDFLGPDEAINSAPPASVVVYSVSKDSPADKAGMMQYDFITEVNGVRVTSLRMLTEELDKHEAGDTVEVTIVRYSDPTLFITGQYTQSEGEGDSFEDYFGNFGGYRGYNRAPMTSTFETIRLNVTLEILDN
jgi:serine protease Do